MTDLYNAGQQFRQAGDLSRAEAAFREAISLEPARAEIWVALGSLAREQRKAAEAVAALEKAASLAPNSLEAYNLLGMVYQEQGRLTDSANAFERAIEIDPASAAVHNNLANVYLALGRKTDARHHYEQAVRLYPQFAEAHGNLGNVLRELGHNEEALASCRLAVQLKPRFAIGRNQLGAVYSSLKRWEEAQSCFREAIRLYPTYPEAHANLGAVLRELGRLTEAEAMLREALRFRPEMAEGHSALARYYVDADRPEAAEAACREALRLKADLGEAWQTLGAACLLQNRAAEAAECFERAVALEPNVPTLHRNLALIQLLLGRYAEGWAEYEWRWRCPEAGERPSDKPVWDGGPLDGRTLLLYAEQGFGDAVQFVRYARLARQRGGRVVVACRPPLVPLLHFAGNVDEVAVLDDPPPHFDVHAGLMDLPRILRTTLETIPAETPYLHVDPGLVEQWRNELASISGFKVGIAWQGSAGHRFDRYRSVALAEFAPLADLPGVTLISLQKGFGEQQLEQVGFAEQVVDLAPRLQSFLDTAAVIENLDLVICCDTCVGHVAGALGRPVWLATPFSPDWRWLLDREDNPWYPSMRLFRQQRRGDWRQVFRRMAVALAERLGISLPAAPLTVEIAAGELLDKIAILQIKAERIGDEAKLRNVRRELASLAAVRDRELRWSAELEALTSELKRANEALWDIEDQIRIQENKEDFGPRFVELARSVYRENDRRAAIKRRINELLGSPLVEEKSYAAY